MPFLKAQGQGLFKFYVTAQLEVVLPGREAKDLPWGRKGLLGGPGIGGNYIDLL